MDLIDLVSVKNPRNSHHYIEMKIFTIYLPYNVADQRSAYVPIYVYLLRNKGGGDPGALPKLSQKEDAMVDPFHITLLSKQSARKEQNMLLFRK